MARNSLEEQLQAIRTTRSMLKLKLKKETDRKHMQELINKINLLNEDEKQTLKDMGVE